ncbi:MAG: hypothetical protein IJ899_20750 [Blautia sp.]|nr:hypothetical protein [Blautia sp.]
MGGEQNLKHFTSKTASEAGKKSGVSRRRKADLRKAMNDILTGKTVKVNGVAITYEEALCIRMVQEALENGNVGAYRAIMDTIGQTAKSDADIREQKARIRKLEAEAEAAKKISEAGVETEDDGFLDALKGTAAQDWGENDET